MLKKILLAVAVLALISGLQINFIFAQASGETSRHTQAYLGIKQDYLKKDGYYTGGKFVSTDSVVVPRDHFAHDALYQFEGPGWESELVGYRLYLDDRNRTDIFGKKTYELVLHKAGINDLVSDGKESYQSMQDWGQDVFKVGSSLGIGSVAAYNDSVVTVSLYDSIYCRVLNTPGRSSVETKHYNWNTGKDKTDIEINYSIAPGSRLTYVAAYASGITGLMCTGLAKHADTEFFTGENESGWCYIALWGKQTIADDSLGIAVIYKKDKAVKQTEDNVNHLVVLKPANGKISYFFGAAWEQEKNGIKSKTEFKTWLDREIEKLSEPVQF
jgi:hypothetical protein